MIDRRWLPLNALRAFEAAGRHLSFTAAANALSVSQSAISRHVIALEALLGTPLFERRPNQFALTEAGAALLPVVRKSFDRMELALNDIVHDRGARARTIRVQMPTSFAHLLAVPILREFRAAYPQIVLDIESPHVIGHAPRDADAAVIYARPQVSDHVANLLWMERLTPLCHPDIATTADLATLLASTELLSVLLLICRQSLSCSTQQQLGTHGLPHRSFGGDIRGVHQAWHTVYRPVVALLNQADNAVLICQFNTAAKHN
jgi:DNA-binding transcriptional LysR family regulator